jgi:DNA-binding LacI/PurR family transcriptional regulator
MGIRLAAEAAIAGGRKNILFINTPETQSARIKEESFRQILREAGSKEISYEIIEMEIDRLRELPEKIKALYRERFFDAVIATDDLYANVTVNTLHYLRIDIPEKAWVMGYNNSYVGDQTYPRLTSVDSRMDDLGRECSLRLDALLKGEPLQERIKYLTPRLVVKESSG